MRVDVYYRWCGARPKAAIDRACASDKWSCDKQKLASALRFHRGTITSQILLLVEGRATLAMYFRPSSRF